MNVCEYLFVFVWTVLIWTNYYLRPVILVSTEHKRKKEIESITRYS